MMVLQSVHSKLHLEVLDARGLLFTENQKD